MAQKRNTEDITRFYMSNAQVRKEVHDENGNLLGEEHVSYASKDFDRQVAEMLRALQSATNGLVRVTKKVDEFGNAMATFDVPEKMALPAKPTFDQTLQNIESRYGYVPGSLTEDPYNQGLPRVEDYKRIEFHKNLHGALAKERAKDIMKELGGSAEKDPTKAQPDRMKMSFDVSQNDWDKEVAKTKGDVNKARRNLVNRFTRANLSEPEKYSKDVKEAKKEKEEEKKAKEEEKKAKKQEREKKAKRAEKKANLRKTFRTIGTIVAIVTAVADITRRILTAVLDNGSRTKQESVQAKNLGISYSSMREYKAQEKAMGLREGIFTSALGSLQSAFGDITNLDEGALSELAKVLQGDVIEAINQGLGKSDPEKLMGLILDTYYKRGEQGINSIGQNVGRYQAERELSTALEKAGLNDVADILRNMFYTNDTGIYKGRIDTEDAFLSYMNLITAYTNGMSNADYGHISELGAVIDGLKKKFDELKDNLEKGLLKGLAHVINELDNWRIGQSAEESLTTDKENRRLNREAMRAMYNRRQSAEKSLEYAFSAHGINFAGMGLKDVTDMNSFFTYLKKHPSDMLDTRNAEIKKLFDLLRTEEGQDISGLILEMEATDSLYEQAKNNLASDGDIKYQQADFTSTGVQIRAQKLLKEKGNISSVRILSGQVKGRKRSYSPVTGNYYNYISFEDLLVDPDIIKALPKEIGLTEYDNLNIASVYEGNSGQYSDLWEGILERARIVSPNAYAKENYYKGGNIDFKKQRELVKQALLHGRIIQEDIYDIVLANYAGGGNYGLTDKQKAKIDKALQDMTARNLSQNYVGYNELINQQLQGWASSLAKEQVMKEGTSAQAVISGYNEKTKEISLTFKLVSADNKTIKTKTYRLSTDAAFDTGVNETIDITGAVRANVSNNSGAGS